MDGMTPPKYSVRLNKRALPSGSWKRMDGCGDLAYEGELPCAEGSHLMCKVLVFKTLMDLLRFGVAFRYADGTGPCEGCVWHCSLMNGTEMWCDKRYACVLGMVAGHVSYGLIAHEAVHVAWSWGLRTRFKAKWSGVEDSWDEHIAYPVGWLVDGMAWRLREAGLLR